MIAMSQPGSRQRGRRAAGQRPLPSGRSNYLSAPCLAFLVMVLLVLAAVARAQRRADVIGAHDLSPAGTSPVKGGLSGSCYYCHAPHSGLNGAPRLAPMPLWNTKLSSVQSYRVYHSSTLVNKVNPSPPLGTDSTLCLSCHDGTVAGSPGATVAYGRIPMTGRMFDWDVFGTNLSVTHPVSFVLPLRPAGDLVSSLTANPPSTADKTGAVRLIKGNVECTSCHNPHVQRIDPRVPMFLVLENRGSALCLACHSPIPSAFGMGLFNVLETGRESTSGVGSRQTAGATARQSNPLAGWTTSTHATATNKLAPQLSPQDTPLGVSSASLAGKRISLGSYGSVSRNGCTSCHTPHNAQGAGALLQEADDQTCLACHNASAVLSPPLASVAAEMLAPKYGHAFSVANSPHRPNEAVVLNQSIHVTCVDCHNPHASGRVGSFPAAPGIRPSQASVLGVSAADGATVVDPAVNQYESCLRCHGASTGKKTSINFGYLPVRVVSATDPLDVIPEFNSRLRSSHPVFHERSSVLPQPSLRANMLNLDGKTLGRSMGTYILCTDCHNSDDNREFGGTGPNGPHGSMFTHILERRYEFSQAPLAGKLITNLFPNPNLSAEGGANGGPYALCAKCHDLNQVLNNSSFSEHARHVRQDGFSCSPCHTGHGLGAQSGNISGERLVNFDLKVVAPNGEFPISYNRASNSCTLVCHNHAHQSRLTSGAGKGHGIR